MAPKLAVSGYRGIWGDTLTEEIARDYVGAFARFLKGNTNKHTILVGRDGRTSGPALLAIIIDELLSFGFDVVDLGMMPTPSMLFLVRSEGAAGAVIATASHNPIEYNGIKFVTENGLFTSEHEVSEIESLRHTPFLKQKRGTLSKNSNLFEKHLAAILTNIDRELIRSKKFRVAVDTINSVGCTTTPKLLEALGVEAYIENGEPTGSFAHEPEPLPKNLGGLSRRIQEKKLDAGFAQDPDADRLVIADEHGNLPSEETMLALCLTAILQKNPGDIAINMSTSRMSEDIAVSLGKKTFRSKVGEANVVGAIRDHGAVAGGEGGGGIIYPKINSARDSFVGIALILELMARTGKSLSTLISELPEYAMAKDKFAFAGNVDDAYKKVRALFSEAAQNTLDGLRLDFPNNSWVHIRPSNTEPVFRIITEARTHEEALSLLEKTKASILS